MALSSQSRCRRFRPLLYLLPLACALFASNTFAQVNTGIDELDEPFMQFVEGKEAARDNALNAIVALERDDTREILDGILSGDLMLHKNTDTIVWATAEGRNYLMQSLDRSEDLGSDSRRRLSRLRVTNKIRGQLRSLIASLGLRSDNPVERLAAIDALIETPEQLPDETLTELLDSETDDKVLDALHSLQARKQINSESAEVRLQALATLSGDLSGGSRSLVQQMAATDSDPSVQDAAAKIATRQAEK